MLTTLLSSIILVFLCLGNALVIPQLDPRQTENATDLYVPIKTGYVAFGDSYAAGIGTGVTEGSGCRRGQFSYPQQLASLAPEADFQNLPCSGAIVTDVRGDSGQISAWSNPERADIATISIGGNDIGFYNILTACVLRVGQGFAGNCDEAISKAYEIINGRELSENVIAALREILTKSGRDDFKIYQTGYPSFFNDATESCDCELIVQSRCQRYYR